MNEEIKKRWVAALRSGEYKQGRDKLCDLDTNSYCCLGVLSEIYAQEHPDEKCRQEIGGEVFYFKCDQVLPIKIVKWAELDGKNPLIESDTICDSVAEMNDRGKPFSEIADLIEEYL